MCGWETLGKVPSESTFSRAFDQFARDGRPQAIHKALIKTHYGETLAGHISRDATAIHAREKAEPKPKRPPEAKGGKRGRRRKDAPPAPPPEPKRLQQPLERDPEANLADLPTVCDWGCKKNSQSKKECWRGYKLHLDVIDGDIPVSAILTSASLHDSQVAIPLAQMSAERIVNLYDRADAAYDAREIREISARLGHVPIIETTRDGARNASSRPPKPCATASAARPKGSTLICTSNTEDGMCACVARSRWLHTSPSAWW